MKLEDQVITKDQAKKIKELGITAEALWYWVYPKMEGMISTVVGVKPEHIALDILSDNEGDEFDHDMAAAYSVAELGVILPGIINKCRLTQWVITGQTDNNISYGMQYRFRGDDPVNYGVFPSRSIFGDTEAKARANLIMALLEEKILTAEEVNNRLTK
jgi:hypothetical protein